MKLQILVPQYTGDTAMLTQLMDSIAMQRGIDFDDISVIIMNDGSPTKIAFRKRFPFGIEYVRDAPHRGISGTRNALIDMATADYVMFCDEDDCFFSSLGILSIFEQMDGDGFDALISHFIEETEDSYISHEKDGTFIHGKVYRLAFLRENDIRFDEDVSRNEDFSFNAAAQALASKILYIDTPFYLWAFNPKSVTRSTDTFIVDTFDEFLIAFDNLIDKMLRDGKKDYAVRYFAIMHSKAKSIMLSDVWFTHSTEAQDRAEEIFGRLCEKYKGLVE